MFVLLLACGALQAVAQENRPFDVTIYDDEYKIYIKMDLQDVLGQMDGYIGSKQSRSLWMIISSTVIDERTAEIEVVNDYGSEDFTAELKVNRDGTYSYRKKDGSTLKFAVKGKWQKIPARVEFRRK